MSIGGGSWALSAVAAESRKRSRSAPSSPEHQTRVGAELPGPHRQRRDELAADRVRAGRQGGGQEIDRVAAAHLRVDRDRFRPAGSDVHELHAAPARAGEANCLDARVRYERGADFGSSAE